MKKSKCDDKFRKMNNFLWDFQHKEYEEPFEEYCERYCLDPVDVLKERMFTDRLEVIARHRSITKDIEILYLIDELFKQDLARNKLRLLSDVEHPFVMFSVKTRKIILDILTIEMEDNLKELEDLIADDESQSNS